VKKGGREGGEVGKIYVFVFLTSYLYHPRPPSLTPPPQCDDAKPKPRPPEIVLESDGSEGEEEVGRDGGRRRRIRLSNLKVWSGLAGVPRWQGGREGGWIGVEGEERPVSEGGGAAVTTAETKVGGKGGRGGGGGAEEGGRGKRVRKVPSYTDNGLGEDEEKEGEEDGMRRKRKGRASTRRHTDDDDDDGDEEKEEEEEEEEEEENDGGNDDGTGGRGHSPPHPIITAEPQPRSAPFILGDSTLPPSLPTFPSSHLFLTREGRGETGGGGEVEGGGGGGGGGGGEEGGREGEAGGGGGGEGRGEEGEGGEMIQL